MTKNSLCSFDRVRVLGKLPGDHPNTKFYSLWLTMKFLLIVFVGVLLVSPYSSQKRFRRIIDGIKLKDRPRHYTAIRYYGALATAHRTWYTFGKVFEFLSQFGIYGSVYCSGSLLTPAIFQTACHCVAAFDISNRNDFFKPPIIQNHWEGMKVTYFGMSNRFGEKSMVTYDYVLTEKFIIDSRCHGLGSATSVAYDYALIQIDSDWLHRDTRGYNWLEIAWAPQYTVEEMEHFHTYALQHQLVCMMIGFGSFYEDKPTIGSDVLRHGWTVLLPHRECFNETGSVQAGNRVVLVPEVFFNWVCTKQFPKHDEYAGVGDSGGPLSCNDRYFALLSGVEFYVDERDIRYDIVVKYHPLIYSVLANSVNYRSKLINSIYRLQRKYTDVVVMDDTAGRGNYEEKLFRMSQNSNYPTMKSTGLRIGHDLFVLLFLVTYNMFHFK